MAFIPTDLVVMGYGNGYHLYRYDTADAHAVVDGAGYFNNTDDLVNLAAGDIIDVIVWTTAAGTEPIITYGRHIVNNVTAGAVDTSDVTVGTVTDSD